MNHPFKIIKGGLADMKQRQSSEPSPTKFAQFDQKRAIMDRIQQRIIANRNKVVAKLRAEGKL